MVYGYINELPEKEQRRIGFKIMQRLVTEGYSDEDIKKAIDVTMDSKYRDVEHVLL